MSARFVFILSPERSGSTLLSQCLGAHPAVTAPPELHLLRFESIQQAFGAYPQSKHSLETLLESLQLSNDIARTDATPIQLYRRILDLAADGSWIVDKTPAYVREPGALETAETLEPSYIWLMRHPLGVVHSRAERRRKRRAEANREHLLQRLRYPAFLLREALRDGSGATRREFLKSWLDAHQRIQRFLSPLPEARWTRVHYEELVRNPETVLKALCQHLGLEFDPAMLNPNALPAKHLSWGLGDQKFLETDGFSPDRAAAWKTNYREAMLPAEMRDFARSVGVALED